MWFKWKFICQRAIEWLLCSYVSVCLWSDCINYCSDLWIYLEEQTKICQDESSNFWWKLMEWKKPRIVLRFGFWFSLHLRSFLFTCTAYHYFNGQTKYLKWVSQIEINDYAIKNKCANEFRINGLLIWDNCILYSTNTMSKNF